MKLHEKIFKYRKQRGLSQEALAEAVGVSRQAVSKWETGEAMPDVANLAALAKALGVSADTLLYDDESEETEQASESDESDSHGTVRKDTVNLAAIPGVFGRFFRKYGWLGGVYLAISGFGFVFVGGIARYISNMVFGVVALPAILAAHNPVDIIANAILLTGGVLIIGGTVLALWLKRRRKNN